MKLRERRQHRPARGYLDFLRRVFRAFKATSEIGHA